MPNWVYNTLTINNQNQRKLKAIAKKLKSEESEFTFQKIVPRPKELDASDAWYDWNIQNWGCKWDASDVYAKIENNTLIYNFSTPWSAPLDLIYKFSKTVPDSLIEYHYEEEQGWGGIYKFKSGIYSEEDSWDIPSSHTDMLSRKAQQCYCFDNEEPYFDDCFLERAKLIPGITPKALEVIKALTKEWDQGFEALVKTANKL